MSHSTTPPPDSSGIIHAIDPTAADPSATKLTDSQKARMDAIERGINEFFAAEVPFMVVASPDVPNAKMRFIHSSRLGYGRELAGMAQQMGICRSQMLSIALKSLSVGLRGGLALYDEEGSPLFVFQNGEMKAAGDMAEVTA